MKILKLDATITSLNTEHENMDVVVDIDGVGCDFSVERQEASFDGFDEVYPARLVIKPKQPNA